MRDGLTKGEADGDTDGVEVSKRFDGDEINGVELVDKVDVLVSSFVVEESSY